jgi:ATP-binding cassette subfamily F protein uup
MVFRHFAIFFMQHWDGFNASIKESDMALITLRDISWGLGGAPLLDRVSLQIEKGERVCLLGRNGEGKSSLIRILAGDLVPDGGDIWIQQGAVISVLVQEVPREPGGTLFDIVADGLGAPGRALAEYRRLTRGAPAVQATGSSVSRLELQEFLDGSDGWTLEPRIEDLIARTGLDPELPFGSVSAGMKRRALFCRALVAQPDLLLLDEPTNHLDIDAIVWMEDYLARYIKTILFVSHDRAFVRRTANRILELDRGRLRSYACDYATYLKRSAADAAGEEKLNRRFDKKLSAEEAWIRQGIKARRTRNEGRVRALKKMREDFRARRRKLGSVNLQIQEAERSGNLVVEAKGISYAWEEVPYVKDLSMVIMRGDKIGLIGPNGAGKTTLLKILLKEMAPDAGTVRHGAHLQIAYFDQLRMQLDENKTVAQNIGEGNDFIVFNGRKRHVISYLQDFLFPPERCRTPVRILSGGEKNRLLLARLFVRPANMLVMDEPTNDLDVETLELLEDLLLDYAGTLLLVSHDRAFLNNVVTSTLAFEGNGRIRQYPGGYDDWLSQRPEAEPAPAPKSETAPCAQPRTRSPQPRKLGYMEQRELEALPQKIEALEAEQQQMVTTLSDPRFYKTETNGVAALKQRLQALEQEIAEAYSRWETLESIVKNSTGG